MFKCQPYTSDCTFLTAKYKLAYYVKKGQSFCNEIVNFGEIIALLLLIDDV